MTKRYITIDLQGMQWRDWTISEPETAKEIIEKFIDIWEVEGFKTEKKDYTLDYIQDIWELEFAEVWSDRAREYIWINDDILNYK